MFLSYILECQDILKEPRFLCVKEFQTKPLRNMLSTSRYVKVCGDVIYELKHEWIINTPIQDCKWFWLTRGEMLIAR